MNNVRINQLAGKYAESRDQFVFTDLYYEVKREVIDGEAIKRARRCRIPKEDFESYICEALWRACEGYDETKGDFLARFHHYLDRACGVVYKHYTAKKRTGVVVSIHNTLKGGEEREEKTFEDVLEADYSLEDEVLRSEKEIRKMLVSFSKKKKTNERNARIIHMLMLDYTNEEIAKELGASEYNATIRKKVQRAKEAFKAYCEIHLDDLLSVA